MSPVLLVVFSESLSILRVCFFLFDFLDSRLRFSLAKAVSEPESAAVISISR